ncbi:MAG TPA: serine/threonine-protein kinase [Gemmatimonadaceae bacterium]|nr:serine/threonine-protein kinase [Gemmatimonadaceae bacterium]
MDAGDELLLMVKQHLGGDYTIEKELGRGGMAVVYKGVEKALERVVAIKVVPPESANAGQAAERFRREARLAASLDHPNIIPVYRVGQAGPLHYMAMKFVEGRAVDAIIEQQGALPIPIAVAILKYSAAGLAFAHEKKIVHRDIKGANILVDKDGRVMVSDFGIARALEEVSLTASGMMIGTPYFMSPEQCGGQKVSPQSDQYSLGVLGFQLLTGEVPFTADSMVGVIQHHYMTPVPDILTVRPDVPKELLDVIYCALNKDPLDRFATTKDMATALENVPISDAQREEAEKVLKGLSMGQAIPKVRTGTLPPLALTISGPGPRVQPRPQTTPRPRTAQGPAAKPVKKKRKNKKAGIIGASMMLLATAGFITVGVQTSRQKAEVARQDSIRRADSINIAQQAALEASRGQIYFAGLPPGFSIDIRGQIFRDSIIPPYDTGSYSARFSADGYVTKEQVITIRSGRLDTVTVALSRTSALAQLPGAATRPNTPAVSAVRDSGQIRLRVTPLRTGVYLMPGRQLLGNGAVIRRLPVGSHTLRYEADGCRPHEFRIEVPKDDIVILNEPYPGCR